MICMCVMFGLHNYVRLVVCLMCFLATLHSYRYGSNPRKEKVDILVVLPFCLLFVSRTGLTLL